MSATLLFSLDPGKKDAPVTEKQMPMEVCDLLQRSQSGKPVWFCFNSTIAHMAQVEDTESGLTVE